MGTAERCLWIGTTSSSTRWPLVMTTTTSWQSPQTTWCASGGGPRRKQGATEKKSSVFKPRPRRLKVFLDKFASLAKRSRDQMLPNIKPRFWIAKTSCDHCSFDLVITVRVELKVFTWKSFSTHVFEVHLFLLYSLSFTWDCPDVALQQLFCIICTVNL